MKVYQVWDQYTDEYFSIVSGKLRCGWRYSAHTYDRRHATRVLQAVKSSYRVFGRTVSGLCLKEIPIMQVEISESIYANTSAKIFTSRKLSFYDGLRQMKYEQVRRYNDYIDYERRPESHSLKLALGMI